MFCNFCGAANPDDASLCCACHQPLSATPSDIDTVQSDVLAPGSLLRNRYRIVAAVGKGGFGTVYQAYDMQEGQRPVAVKLLTMSGLQGEALLEASEAVNREVRILSMLQHPNLPRLYDYFTLNNSWCLVMDFIEGQTLRVYLEQQWLVDKKSDRALQTFLGIAQQLCAVLEYLHAQQPPFIFRDLKPENIMLTPLGRVYLIDFGIVRRFVAGQHRDTVALGSPGYAAPEQYGKEQTTPRSDIYSLGVVWHEMLTGQDPTATPFRFAAMRTSNPTLPPKLETLILQMVDLDPDLRPKNVQEIQERLLFISQPTTTPNVRIRASQATSSPSKPVLPQRSSAPEQPNNPSSKVVLTQEEVRYLRSLAKREQQNREARPTAVLVAVVAIMILIIILYMTSGMWQEKPAQQENPNQQFCTVTMTSSGTTVSPLCPSWTPDF